MALLSAGVVYDTSISFPAPLYKLQLLMMEIFPCLSFPWWEKQPLLTFANSNLILLICI